MSATVLTAPDFFARFREQLTKAVVRKSQREAIPLLERLIAEGNAPQQILALLLWQLRKVAHPAALLNHHGLELPLGIAICVALPVVLVIDPRFLPIVAVGKSGPLDGGQDGALLRLLTISFALRPSHFVLRSSSFLLCLLKSNSRLRADLWQRHPVPSGNSCRSGRSSSDLSESRRNRG